MTLVFWDDGSGPKLLFRNGSLAKHENCCCEEDEDCGCCQLVKGVELTISAPGCCINGEVLTAEADDEDTWTNLSMSGCVGCEADDGIFFELICYNGSYRLGMERRQTFEPVSTWCYANAIDCTCDTGSGQFELVFELECDWCCPGTTITITAVTYEI